MRNRWWMGLVLCALAPMAVAQAQQPAAPPPPAAPNALPGPATSDVVDMEAVTVSGAQPGPGMWKVSKGGHVMYVLGTIAPLPKRIDWIPGDVEKTIASAQAVIDPPSVKLETGLGFFRKMFLLPSLLKARRNPDGRTLQQVVTPELYARWLPLKQRYIGSSNSVERWRPIFAAQKLFEDAMDRQGLRMKSVVRPVVNAAAKRYKVPRIATVTTFTITDPKKALREFNGTVLSDTDCFAKTLVRIERDLATMAARGNAWAVGDVAALRDLPMEDQYTACTRAVTDSALAQRLGLGDVRGRIAATWLAAVRKSIAANPVTFTTLPIPLLVHPDGFITRLRAEGYTVEEPE